MTIPGAKTAPDGTVGHAAIMLLAALIALSPLSSSLLSLGLLASGQSRVLLTVNLSMFASLAVVATAIATGMRTADAGLRPKAWQIPLLAFFALAFAGGFLLSAVDPGTGIQRFSEIILYLALIPSLAWIVRLAGDTGRQAFTLAIVLSVLLHLPLVAAGGLSGSAEGQDRIDAIQSAYFHYRLWGVALAAALAALLGEMAARPDAGRTRRALALAATTLLAAALFWSGTRSGLMGLIATGLFSAALLGWPFLRVLPGFLAALAFGAVLSLAFAAPDPNFGLLGNFLDSGNAEGLDSLSAGRLSLWAATWQAILDAPVFGHGFDQFGAFHETVRLPGTMPHVQPHNSILQFLFDFGFLGGGALIVLLLALWLKAIARTLRGPVPANYGALTALNALLAMSLVDGVLYHDATLFLVCLCLGILLAPPEQPAHA